jgi:mono/diheme cytochrome c family protein
MKVRRISCLLLLLCSGCRSPSPENGVLLFHDHCLVCHTVAPGSQRNALSLAGYFRRNPVPDPGRTRQLIRNGRGLMQPFRDRLSNAQIDDVIAYLKTR